MSLPPYTFITGEPAWQECLAALRDEPAIALDLESNSMYVYRERICLIQISTPTHDYIVDPLQKLNFDGLGELVQDPTVQKILHAAEYDMILMKQEHDWDLHNLFDTQWAARILGYERVGLANILEETFGVVLDKQFQRMDWGKRPLTSAHLNYAQGDTHYLFRLREKFVAELEAGGHEEEAFEAFEMNTVIRPKDGIFDPESFWGIPGIKLLQPRQRATLRALAIFRDQEAKKQDLPHFKIMGNKTLLALAEAQPRSMNQLPHIDGVGHNLIRRYGTAILRVIEAAQKDPLPTRPPRQRLPDAVQERYDNLSEWRKQRGLARGVESDVIISREAVMALAKANPKTTVELEAIPELPPWRRQVYGQEILAVLRKR